MTMQRRVWRKAARLVALGLMAIGFVPLAMAAPGQPAVPAQIYGDANKLLAEDHIAVRGGDADAPPAPLPQDFMFKAADINGDGIMDWRVRFAGVGFGFCGTGGCTNRIYVSRADGSYELVLDTQVRQLTIEPTQGEGAMLTLEVHGGNCKGSGNIECLLAFRWNEAQRAFQPVATPRAKVRIGGFEMLPGNAGVPAVLKQELRKFDAECARISKKQQTNAEGSASRTPDFDGDGRADWVLTGGGCLVGEGQPYHVLPTSVWLDRPEGLRKVLDWKEGGYSIDIGSERAIFNGEGADECFYGMGSCTATSFAWSAATQRMEPYPNTPPPPADLAALAKGEALIADRFARDVSAEQLAEAIALADRFAAVRAPIDPLLGRVWLVEGALRSARGDIAGAEAKLRRAGDIFAFAGEAYSPQRAMTWLVLARAIEAPARREERAGAAMNAIGALTGDDAVPTSWQARRAWEIYIDSARCDQSCFPGREQLARLYQGGVGEGPDAFVDRHRIKAFEAAFERSELRWSAALALDQALLAETQAADPAAADRVAGEQKAVADDLIGLGRFGEAVALSQSASEALARRFGPDDLRTLEAASDHGALLLAAGRLAEAEALLRRTAPRIAALARAGHALPLAQRRLAETALALGKLDEAGAALEQARAAERLLNQQEVLDAAYYDDLATPRALGQLRALSGDRAAAGAAFAEGMLFAQFYDMPPPASVALLLDYLDFAPPLDNAGARETLASTIDAETPTMKAIAERAYDLAQRSYPEGHPMIARAARIRARLLIALGDEGARDAAEESLTAAMALPGDGTTGGLEPRTDLARVLAMAGADDGARALDLARQAVAIARERRQRKRAGGGAAVDRELKRAFIGFALAASAKQATDGALPPALADEAFGALQEAEVSQAAVAIARATLARQAAGTPVAADVARLNAAEERARGLDRLYLGALAKGDGSAAEALRGEIDAAAASQSAMDAGLRKALPTYGALADQTPLSLADVQARLGGDAALLLLGGDDRDMAAMLVTREGAYLSVARGYAPAFEVAADRLRCSVEPTHCSAQAAEALEDMAVAAGADESLNAPFDRAGAQAIYTSLIAPLAGHVAPGTTLLVVQQGAIGRVPLAVLPVAAPASADPVDPAKMADVIWLIDQHPLLLLPSVSVLATAAPAGERAKARFLGFGNPAFRGKAADARGLSGLARATRGGELASVADLDRLSPLPGTQRELEAMRTLMNAGTRDVVTGAAANEGAIKDDNRLGQATVLAFATHGLLPNEVAGLAEPGLVFTPPKVASARDDGFLAASEVAAFRLEADQVILSACNTASTSGEPGADSLSALARSFLLAGARSVLASRWSVPDAATAALTVETLRLQQAGSQFNRAQALQAAMIAVRKGARADGSAMAGADAGWAHPMAWGAFVAIGSGL